MYYVYILASKKNGTLYVGVTNDLIRRVHQHKECLVVGFTSVHHVHRLVYYELHSDSYEAIRREKLIKRWRRRWNLRLIEETNPEWKDLYDELIEA